MMLTRLKIDDSTPADIIPQNCEKISQLPDELLLKIFNYLPSYSFLGSKNIGLVCAKWKQLKNDSALSYKLSDEEIVKSTDKLDLNSTLHILTEEDFLERLSIKEIIFIALKQPKIVNAFLETHSHNESMLQDFLSYLGWEEASEINYTPGSLKIEKIKMTLESLSLLALIDYGIAEYILDTPELSNELGGRRLVKLARKHLSIAERILSKSEYYNQLKKSEIVILGSINVTLAHTILNTPALYKQLDNAHFILAQHHLSIAEDILNTSTLYEKLDTINLVKLGINHFSIAQRIFKDEAVYKKLNHEELTFIGKEHLSIAQYILNTPELCNKLKGQDWAILGEHHPTITQHIFDNPAIYNLLSQHELVHIGMQNLTIAQHLLSTPILCDKLSGNDLEKLGRQHFSIAEYTLAKETLYTKLDAQNITNLGKRDCRNAITILNNPKLSGKLCISDLVSFFFSHCKIANQLFNSEVWKNKILCNNEVLIKLMRQRAYFYRTHDNTPYYCYKLLSTERSIEDNSDHKIAMLGFTLAKEIQKIAAAMKNSKSNKKNSPPIKKGN